MNRAVLSLLTFITLITSCKKDDQTEKAILEFSFNSIYKVQTFRVAVFEGWVDATSNDLDKNVKKFYAVARYEKNNFTLELPEGRYTLLAEYGDFNQFYTEKIDLKQGKNDVILKYDRKLNFDLKFNSLVYNINDKIYSMLLNPASLVNLTILGVECDFTLNGQKFVPYAGKAQYNYSISPPKSGLNEISLSIKYPSGVSDLLTYKILIFTNNSIQDIFDNLTKPYFDQIIFPNKFAVENDIIVNNTMVPKSIIIKGIYGTYGFSFIGEQLNEVRVNHGNIGLEPTLTFGNIKLQLDKVFGSPVFNSENNFTYKVGNFTIDLFFDKSNIISLIRKR